MMMSNLVIPRISEEKYRDLVRMLKLSPVGATIDEIFGLELNDLQYSYPPLHNTENRKTIVEFAEMLAPVRLDIQTAISASLSGLGNEFGVEFDTAFSMSINKNLEISTAQAADKRIWWLINSVVFGDLLVWRWRSSSGEISGDRYQENLGQIGRGAFSRLWRRRQIFDELLLAKFKGEAIDQILERPKLRDDHEIANLILANIARCMEEGAVQQQGAQRAVVALSKRLLRRFAVVNSISLSSQVKANLVRDELEQMLEQMKKLRISLESTE